ncbi:hypothetical protein ACLMJK_009682 [Lecanora helva]
MYVQYLDDGNAQDNESLTREDFVTFQRVLLLASLGVVGVATAAIQSSKAVFELVDNFKEGSDEIASISKDMRAFPSVITSLNSTLKDESITNVISGDSAITEMVQLLQNPLSNCQIVLGEIMFKIEYLLRLTPHGKGQRTPLANVKWSLSTKTKVRSLLLRLEATKSTLVSALNAINTLCAVRLLGMSKVKISHQVELSRGEVHVVGEGCADIGSDSSNSEILERMIEAYHINNEKGVQDGRKNLPVALSAQKAHREAGKAIMRSFQEHLSQILSNFSEHKMQTRCLEALTKPDNPKEAHHSLEGSMKCDGEIDYSLPKSNFGMYSSFYPEQYSTDSIFVDPVFVFVVVYCWDDPRHQKYFLTYLLSWSMMLLACRRDLVYLMG